MAPASYPFDAEFRAAIGLHLDCITVTAKFTAPRRYARLSLLACTIVT